jgi:V/A-type H+-transporting ATPase subunit I
MGVTPLSKVTVIAPRADYQDVLKQLSKFRDFDIIEEKNLKFDPFTEELAIRSVRLLAQVDQLVKDLEIPLAPGMMDVVFRGASIPQTGYEVASWGDLVGKAERDSEPIRNQVRAELTRHSQLVSEESETEVMAGVVQAYSNISANIGKLTRLERLHTVVTISPDDSLGELQRSLPDSIFVTQSVGQLKTIVLLASPTSDRDKVEKVLKTLDLKPFILPENLPENPSEAYKKLTEELGRLHAERLDSEAKIAHMKDEYAQQLLATREVAETAHDVLDETRKTGGFQRFAVTSGYIPKRRESDFLDRFKSWICYSEPTQPGPDVPILMKNGGPLASFELITKEQGTPGSYEVDPTSLVSIVFPIFFGLMFGDLGHGLILCAFALLVRHRGQGSLRRWGNIFLACGISSCIFGVIFGEFFGTLFNFGKYDFVTQFLNLELVKGGSLQFTTTVPAVLVISLLIGIAHITTGLSLNIAEGVKGHETIEVLTERLPNLVMYLSGVGFGLAFIGAGYSFNVFGTSKPVPLLGIPTSTMGTASVIVVFVAMIWLATGKGIAIATGKLHGGSAGSAFADGGIEVFERISQFLANTISYARLAILLLVHAAFLILINQLAAYPIYVAIAPMVFFNILILVFETLIVYIQDLRLHIYEFFTKFYQGDGIPFKRLLPIKLRTRVDWV